MTNVANKLTGLDWGTCGVRYYLLPVPVEWVCGMCILLGCVYLGVFFLGGGISRMCDVDGVYHFCGMLVFLYDVNKMYRCFCWFLIVLLVCLFFCTL